MKFLGFEQTFKNSLTTLPMGGGKGGSDFDQGQERRRSDGFCQSFMTELAKHIGPDTERSRGRYRRWRARGRGYMFGQYKRLQNEFTGVLTGKRLTFGGSLVRTEATGYGLCYFTDNMLRAAGKSFEGQKIVISGSGNVAIYANQKAQQLGGKVIAMSDSSANVYDPNRAFNLDVMKQIKEVERGPHHRICQARARQRIPSRLAPASGRFPCDIALPCATQNEINAQSAQALVDNGC
jgi:glutamate dehydrogenase (NADP+)